MRTAKTLIRLGRCPGWSESLLSAHSLCWFCHVAAHLCLWLFLHTSFVSFDSIRFYGFMLFHSICHNLKAFPLKFKNVTLFLDILGLINADFLPYLAMYYARSRIIRTWFLVSDQLEKVLSLCKIHDNFRASVSWCIITGISEISEENSAENKPILWEGTIYLEPSWLGMVRVD